MISRFFCPGPLAAPGEIELPEAAAHHAQRVLRLRDGESVCIFDGAGREYPATLRHAGKRVYALLEAGREPQRESPLAITLVQALASADKMDLVIQKAVELGAAAVIPLQAERSVLRLSGERADKRLAHWRQVAISACEQCGRNRVPEVADIASWRDYLAQTAGVRRLLLAPGGLSGLSGLAPPGGPLHLLIGPEGGWSDAELAAARAAGCEFLTLGPRVLRTETAGLAALAALQARWGDFV